MQQRSTQPPKLHDSFLNERKRERYKRVDDSSPNGFLAKGMFGKVYIAEDTKPSRLVAIQKQRYPSAEAARELAFAKVLASSQPIGSHDKVALRYPTHVEIGIKGGGGCYQRGGRWALGGGEWWRRWAAAPSPKT